MVVHAHQDRLSYGSTFEAALRSLIGGEVYSLILSQAPSQPQANAPQAGKPAPVNDINTLIEGAARDLDDYQRLTAQGKLGEAGQKLEQLKEKP